MSVDPREETERHVLAPPSFRSKRVKKALAACMVPTVLVRKAIASSMGESSTMSEEKGGDEAGTVTMKSRPVWWFPETAEASFSTESYDEMSPGIDIDSAAVGACSHPFGDCPEC